MKKKLKKLKRYISHLEYKMAVLSSKSLNNLLQRSDEDIDEEIKEIKKEINQSERLYNALKFEFNCIKYTMIGVIGMIIYLLIMHIP
jgi:archaellum component FlaC